MQLRQIETNSCVQKLEFSFSNRDIIELMRGAFAKGAFFRFKVKGFSMFPFIQDEDIVTLSAPSLSTITLGEVVAFICPIHRNLIIHRVVGKRKGYYLLKGDNASMVDGLIQGQNILGCVTRVERQGKNVLLGLGPERLIIASLSRIRLFSLFSFILRMVPAPIKKFVKCRFLS